MASSRWFLARRPSSEIHSRSLQLRLDLLAGVQLLLGEQAGLDALGELDLLLGVEQRDLADLLEVVLDRVGRGAGDLTTCWTGSSVSSESDMTKPWPRSCRPWRRLLLVAVLGVLVVGRRRRPRRPRRPRRRPPRPPRGRPLRARRPRPRRSRRRRRRRPSWRRPSWPRRLAARLGRVPSSPWSPWRRRGRLGRCRCTLLGLHDGLGGRAGLGAGGSDGTSRHGGLTDADAGGREAADDGAETLGVLDVRLLARGAQLLGAHGAVGPTAQNEVLQGGVLELTRKSGMRGLGRHERPFGSATPGTGPGGR